MRLSAAGQAVSSQCRRFDTRLVKRYAFIIHLRFVSDTHTIAELSGKVRRGGIAERCRIRRYDAAVDEIIALSIRVVEGNFWRWIRPWQIAAR